MGTREAASSAHLVAPGPEPYVSLLQALAGMRLHARRGVEKRFHDLCMDTEDWWLLRAGAACTVRSEEGGRPFLALQLSPARQPGPAPIPALSEWLDGDPDEQPGPLPGRLVSAWLAPLMGQAPVKVHMELGTRQTAYRARSDDGLEVAGVASLSQLPGLTADAGLTEVNLCLVAGRPAQFAAMLQRLAGVLGAQVTDGSLLRKRLEAGGLALPRPPNGEGPALRASDRFVDAAYRVLRLHFGRMLWHEPGTRLGLDAECLHDMRVATRRMRSALRVFRQALPPRRHDSLRRDLGWLGGALGRVRDLDVYLVEMEAMARADAGLRSYVDDLLAQRQATRIGMLRVLDTRRYASFVERTARFLAAGPPVRPRAPQAGEPLVSASGRTIRKRLAKVLQDGRAVGPRCADDDLHRLRIRAKRLRYACEFFADLYGRPAHKFARRVTDLQDALGAHQDAVVARHAVTDFALRGTGRRVDVRDLYLALGRLMERQDRRAQDARRKFFAVWQRFDRPKIRRPLRRALKKD